MIRVDSNNANQHDVTVLLQNGVYVERTNASTVNEFVCELLEIEPETAHKDIKTIMMDNKVVDDPETEPVRGAVILVLSGAMPGLVGAMLRCDSPYKAMRSTITSATAVDSPDPPPMIKIKFFNTVLKKYAESMIRRGFWKDEDGG